MHEISMGKGVKAQGHTCGKCFISYNVKSLIAKPILVFISGVFHIIGLENYSVDISGPFFKPKLLGWVMRVTVVLTLYILYRHFFHLSLSLCFHHFGSSSSPDSECKCELGAYGCGKRIRMKLSSHMDSGVCYLHIIFSCDATTFCLALVDVDSSTNKLRLMHTN